MRVRAQLSRHGNHITLLILCADLLFDAIAGVAASIPCAVSTVSTRLYAACFARSSLGDCAGKPRSGQTLAGG